MKPYNDWLTLARRWDKCVDAGSPVTARFTEKVKCSGTNITDGGSAPAACASAQSTSPTAA